MRKTRRSINPNDPNAIRMIIEYIEVAEGLRKSGDRKPTLSEIKDLIAGGVTNNFTGGAGGSADGTGSSNIVPQVPSSIATQPIINGIIISWAIPTQKTISKTEVWRSATPALADSVQIGFTSGSSYTDHDCGYSQTWYYFLRNVLTVSLGAKTGSFSSAVSATSLAQEPLPSAVLAEAKQYTDDHAGSGASVSAPMNGKPYAFFMGGFVEIMCDYIIDGGEADHGNITVGLIDTQSSEYNFTLDVGGI